MNRELEERNIATVRQLFDVTGRGDWPAAEALLTDDFVATEAASLPFGGAYRGKGGLRELFEIVMGMAGVAGLDIHSMTAGGDWVITLVDLLAGPPPHTRVSLAEAYRLRDGQVCEIRAYYFDAALVHAAVAAQREVKASAAALPDRP